MLRIEKNLILKRKIPHSQIGKYNTVNLAIYDKISVARIILNKYELSKSLLSLFGA